MNEQELLDEGSGSSKIILPASADSRQTDKPTKKRNVLVIEDDDVDFRIVSRTLAKIAGVDFHLLRATCLSEGLERLVDSRVHVALLDLGLPDSQGLETFRSAHSHAPHVPFIVLSGLDDESVAVDAVRQGAQDYLVKGKLDGEMLLRSISYAITRHSTQWKLKAALLGAKAIEENLRNILSSNVDAILVIDGTGVVHFRNAAADHLFGSKAGELEQVELGLPLIHGEATELDLVQRGGSQVPVEMRVVAVNWQGQPCHLVTLRDLTQQRKADAQLARLASIVNATDDAILSADLDGILLSWNPGAEKMFGYSAGEAVGKHASLLWSPEHREAGLDIIEKIKRGEAVSQHETVRVHKDGRKVNVSLSVSPILDRHGEVLSIAGILSDITSRKQAEKDRVKRLEAEREINIARKVQQSLFPDAAPSVAGFDIAGAVFPAEQASGDYYDFISMADETIGFVVGDVSGHGLGPALLMSQTQAHLRALVETHNDVGEILTHANRLFRGDTPGRFVTLLLVCIDPRARTFVYASAGHRGYFLTAAGEANILDSTGTPIGIGEEMVITSAPGTALAAGDLIVLTTDGIEEAMSPNETVFGVENTLAVIRANRERPAGEIVQALHEAARDFTDGGRQVDDITAVVIKVLETP